MSAFNAGNRMESYALIPIFGMNNAEASFTGQNVGAEKYGRVRRGFRAGTAMSCCMSVLISAALYLLAPDFARLFSLEGEALAQAVEYQRFMSLCIILFALYMPASGLLQGAGDVVWTSMMSFSTLALRVAAAIRWSTPSAWAITPAGGTSPSAGAWAASWPSRGISPAAGSRSEWWTPPYRGRRTHKPFPRCSYV